VTGKQKTIGLETGFTLIEMLVVIVLIGLLFSLTLPRFSGIGETEKLRKAARLMARQALKAHSQAVTEAQPYFLCLDLDLSRTWLTLERPQRDEEAKPDGRATHLSTGVEFKDVVHSEGGMFKDRVVAFAFWSNGGNEPGTIHLRNSSGEEMTIFLRPFLGQTEIHEGYLLEEVE